MFKTHLGNDEYFKQRWEMKIILHRKDVKQKNGKWERFKIKMENDEVMLEMYRQKQTHKVPGTHAHITRKFSFCTSGLVRTLKQWSPTFSRQMTTFRTPHKFQITFAYVIWPYHEPFIGYEGFNITEPFRRRLISEQTHGPADHSLKTSA